MEYFNCCVCPTDLQPLSPLELVKAARKAHGESTDVGSQFDLWGEEVEGDSVDGKDGSVMVSNRGVWLITIA